MTSFANTDDDPSTFLSRFLDSHGGYAIVDGGLATELQLHGADLNDPLCSAICLLTSPDLIRRVHLDYLEAGASIIISDSYQATIEGFEAKGLSRTESEILLRKSVEIACEARDIYNERCIDMNSSIKRPILVAASIGSYAAYLADGSEYSGDFGEGVTVETLKDFHRRRLQVLAESGPDLIAFETIPNKLEAQAYSELLEEERIKLPVWFTFSCKDSEKVVNGDPITDCASIADSCKNVAAVGVNCTAPKFVKGLILSIKKVTNKPIVVYPYTLNSGEKYDSLTKQWWPKSSGITDEEFVSYVGEWLDSGATLVGGCCLTTPDTIRAIVKTLPTKSVQPGKIRSLLRSFLWSGSSSTRKSMVAWNKVCKPVNEGGLGLKDMLVWNTTSIAKIIYELGNYNDDNPSLWCQWIHANTIKNDTIWTTTASPSHSATWRDILQVRDKLLTKGTPTQLKAIMNGSNNKFQSKDIYNLLRTTSPILPWNVTIWGKLNSPRCSFITWLAALGKLPTDTKRHQWGSTNNKNCPVCNNHDETEDHIFLQCPTSNATLDIVLKWLLIPPRHQTILDWLDWFGSPNMQSFKSQIYIATFTTFIYHIWRSRNDLIFNHTTSTPVTIAHKIMTHVKLLASLKWTKHTATSNQWKNLIQIN